MTAVGWTSADLKALPYAEGIRYEIIGGELYVSKAPHANHQAVCTYVSAELVLWSTERGDGSRPLVAPGVIFADDDDVIPDIVWASRERLQATLRADGHFHAAPELVVEVLSPGSANEKRDRDLKLKLYSRRGVREYWIVDWGERQIEVYRRADAALTLVATLLEDDTLTSPLLPGFSLRLPQLWETLLSE